MFGSLFNIKQTLEKGNLKEFRVRLVNIMAVLGFVIYLFYSVFALQFPNLGVSIYFIILSLLFLLALLLNNKYKNTAKLLTVFLSIFAITSSIVCFGRETEVQIFLGIILFLVFLLFDSKKAVSFFGLLIFLLFLGSFSYGNIYGPMFSQYRLPNDYFINFGYGLFGILLLAYVIINAISSYLRQTNESLIRLKEKNKELVSKNTLIEKQKNEMEFFTSIASHDLKSPIRVMHSFLGLIQKKIDSPEHKEDVKKYLKFVFDGSNELNGIINGISTFRKIGDYDISDSYDDSVSIFERVVNQVKSEQDNKLDIISNLEQRLKINGSHLELLFYILISNAVDFNENEIKQVHFNVRSTSDAFIIEVTDNGIGIDKKYANYIFEPFKKLNNNVAIKRTGLGLTNAKKIVEMYGGTIKLDLDYSGGSKFIITFPKEIIL